MKTIVFLSLGLMLTSLVKAQTLTVNVSDIHGTGTLMVGVFDSQESFDNHQIVMGNKIKIDNETTTTQSIFNLNPGTYGVAIWLDENNDGQYQPSENHYGFSNDYIPDSPPIFDLFKFDLNMDKTENIEMQ